MYTAPELFKAAFSYRDFAKEASFLRHVVVRRRGDGLINWMDVACGSGEHLQVLASFGDRCVGIDISEETIAFARRHSAEARFICGDVAGRFEMRDSFDAVICMNDSISHFVTDAEVAGLFENVARVLEPDGLFIVETQFSRGSEFEEKTLSDWTCDHEGRAVAVQWRNEDSAGQLHSTICIEYLDENGERQRHIERFSQRRFTQAQLESTAAEHHMNYVASYGDFDDTVTMSDPAAWRAIYVFQKRSRHSI